MEYWCGKTDVFHSPRRKGASRFPPLVLRCSSGSGAITGVDDGASSASLDSGLPDRPPAAPVAGLLGDPGSGIAARGGPRSRRFGVIGMIALGKRLVYRGAPGRYLEEARISSRSADSSATACVKVEPPVSG